MANSGYYTEPKLNSTGGGSSLTIREADGTPSGVVTELVFPNGTISIASGVGTLTLVGDADSRLGVVYDIAEGLPVLSVLDATWSFLNNTYRDNFRTAIDAAAASHTHGNISNAGAIGSTADLPISTTASGVLAARTIADFRGLLGLATTDSPTFAGVTVANDGDTYLTVNATTGSGQIAGIRLQRGTTGDAFTDWIVEANAGNLLFNRSSSGVVSTPVAFTDAASNIITIASDRAYGWSNSTTAGVASDLLLFRGGAGVLFQRNATNGQISRIAKTFTSSSNFEAIDIDASSDASNYRIGSRIGSAGGTTRGLQLGAYNAAGAWTSWLGIDSTGTLTINNDGNSRWQFNAGEFTAAGIIRPTSNNVRNLGTTTMRWATVFGVNADFSGDLTITPSSSRTLSTNGQFSIEMTSDTAGNLVYRGSDSVTRRFPFGGSIAAFEGDQNLRTTDSPTFAEVYATGNVRSGSGLFSRTDSTTGLSCVSSASLALVLSGTQLAGSGNANEFTIRQSSFLGFSSSSSSVSASPDTGFRRDAANTLAQRNGTNGQISRIYKTFTSATNFETFEIDAASDASNYRIGSRIGSAGGTTRGLQLGRYDAAGAWTSWLGIGTTGSTTVNGADQVLTLSSSTNFALIRAVSAATPTRFMEFGWASTRFQVACQGNFALEFETNNTRRFVVEGGGDCEALANFTFRPSSSRTLSTNGQFSIEMTSNTAGNLVYRGSDGTTRRMALTFS